MRIKEICSCSDHTLRIVADDGRIAIFDVSPYLQDEAFADLKNQAEFMRIHNGKYFVEWACGADLSADTIEAQWQLLQPLPLTTKLS